MSERFRQILSRGAVWCAPRGVCRHVVYSNAVADSAPADRDVGQRQNCQKGEIAVVREEQELGAPDQVFEGDEADRVQRPAVLAVVAVVAHEKVLARAARHTRDVLS